MIQRRIHRTRFNLHLLWVCLLAFGHPGSTLAQTDPEIGFPIQIEREEAELRIVVPTAPEEGVFLLLEGRDLGELSGEPRIGLLTNAPTADPLYIPLTPSQQAFYRVVGLPGRSLDEFEGFELHDEPSSPLALWALGLPEQLISEVPLTVHFLLMATMSEAADFTGAGLLQVTSVENGMPHPDSQTNPMEIHFERGIAQVVLEIHATGSLDGYGIFVILPEHGTTQPVHGAGLLAPASQFMSLRATSLSEGSITPITFPLVYALERIEELRAECFDLPHWSSPLAPGTQPGVSGSFGEWRGNIRRGAHHANVHAGLDLVAPEGMQIYAARGGRVSHIGTDHGRYVVIDHLDGWYSRYFHLSTTGLPTLDTCVKRGDPIGVVAGRAENGNLPPHLHFELQRADANMILLTGGAPGVGLDPLRQGNLFDVQPASSHDLELKLVGITSANPATSLYQSSTSPARGNPDSAFLVVQVRHNRGGNYLAPRFVRFQSEDMPLALELTTPSEPAITSLLPASTPASGGFARYLHGTAKSWDREEFYRYWFPWNTSGYETQPDGPRSFTVEAGAYALPRPPISDESRTWSLEWGPQVEDGIVRSQPTPLQYQFTLVAHLGADNEHAPGLVVQPDRYTIEIVDASRRQLADVTWREGQGSLSGDAPLTRLFRTHAEEQIYTFTLPEDTDPSGLKLRVSSLLVPAIAHEVSLEPAPPSAPGMVSIIIHSFEGTFWDGVPIPVTVTGTVNPGDPGRSVFTGSNGKQERGVPLLSGVVTQADSGATFFVCDDVRNLPGQPGGPPVNRTGASSFIAVSEDGGMRWVNFSVGAWRLSGNIVSDWEYQLRYASGDGTPEHPPSLEIGTVPNSNVFLGQPITEYEVEFEP